MIMATKMTRRSKAPATPATIGKGMTVPVGFVFAFLSAEMKQIHKFIVDKTL